MNAARASTAVADDNEKAEQILLFKLFYACKSNAQNLAALFITISRRR